MLARALRPVLLARAFPRTLVQLTLQVLRAPPAGAPPGPFAHSVRPLPHDGPARRAVAAVGRRSKTLTEHADAPDDARPPRRRAAGPPGREPAARHDARAGAGAHRPLLPRRVPAVVVVVVRSVGAAGDGPARPAARRRARPRGRARPRDGAARLRVRRVRRRRGGGEGELLLAESEGDFSMAEWEAAWGAARRGWIGCVGDGDGGEEGMSVDGEEGGVRLDGGERGGAARDWLAGVVRG